MYPPIAHTIGAYVRLPQGRTFLVNLLLFGMNGEVKSRGAVYEGFMPPAADMSDSDLAEAINYILETLNAAEIPRDFKRFTPAEFKGARANRLTASDVYLEREKLIALLSKRASARSGGL